MESNKSIMEVGHSRTMMTSLEYPSSVHPRSDSGACEVGLLNNAPRSPLRNKAAKKNKRHYISPEHRSVTVALSLPQAGRLPLFSR